MVAKRSTVLIADDDPQILRLVSRNLQLASYAVLEAADGQQALEQIEARLPDLVLLDVMMPRLDGFTVCERVRQFSAVPIIMLTARGQDEDKIHGLNLGADDYLSKPFNVEELLARVRAVLRRSQYDDNNQYVPGLQSIVHVGDLTIDLSQHLVNIGGHEVELTPTEYRLLVYLAQNARRIVTQDLALAQVWGEIYTGESHLLQVTINRLRYKLEPDPHHPQYVLTKLGVGYVLTAPGTSTAVAGIVAPVATA